MIFSRIVPLLLIIGAIGLFVGYVQPTYGGSITTLNGEIRDLDTALLAARQFKEKEAQLTAQRDALSQEQLGRLESFLPDSVDNVQLIVDLNSLAARSGVQLSQFTITGGDTGSVSTASTAAAPNAGAATPPGSTMGAAPLQAPTSNTLALQTSEPTESLELSVSATGSYAAFRTFLAGVEQSLRPLDVIELSVQDSKTGVYTYDITFRLYWLR